MVHGKDFRWKENGDRENNHRYSKCTQPRKTNTICFTCHTWDIKLKDDKKGGELCTILTCRKPLTM